MKIYKVHMDLSDVIARLKQFKLQEYNHALPIIFVEAKDPDGACFKAYQKLNLKILSRDHSVETIEFAKDVLNEVRVLQIEIANEKKL